MAKNSVYMLVDRLQQLTRHMSFSLLLLKL